MATPERPHGNTGKKPSLSELTTELDELTRQLEIADENENQIERFFRRSELLEQQDWLHEQISDISAQE